MIHKFASLKYEPHISAKSLPTCDNARDRVQVAGFRVLGSGFRSQGAGFRVRGSEFGFQGPGFRVQGLGSTVQGSRCRVQGAEFRDWAVMHSASASVAISVPPWHRGPLRIRILSPETWLQLRP